MYDKCFSCDLPECVDTCNRPREKRGRKPLDPEVKRQKKLAYNREYNKKHRERLNAMMRENYYRKKHEKEASRDNNPGVVSSDNDTN